MEDRDEFNQSLRGASGPAFTWHESACQVFSGPLLSLLQTLHAPQSELLGRTHRSPSQETGMGDLAQGFLL